MLTWLAWRVEATNTYEGFPIASNPVKRETFLPKVIELFWYLARRANVVFHVSCVSHGFGAVCAAGWDFIACRW